MCGLHFVLQAIKVRLYPVFDALLLLITRIILVVTGFITYELTAFGLKEFFYAFLEVFVEILNFLYWLRTSRCVIL